MKALLEDCPWMAMLLGLLTYALGTAVLRDFTLRWRPESLDELPAEGDCRVTERVRQTLPPPLVTEPVGAPHLSWLDRPRRGILMGLRFPAGLYSARITTRTARGDLARVLLLPLTAGHSALAA